MLILLAVPFTLPLPGAVATECKDDDAAIMASNTTPVDRPRISLHSKQKRNY